MHVRLLKSWGDYRRRMRNGLQATPLPTIISAAGRPRPARVWFWKRKTWLCARSDDRYFRTLLHRIRERPVDKQQASDEKHRRFHKESGFFWRLLTCGITPHEQTKRPVVESPAGCNAPTI